MATEHDVHVMCMTQIFFKQRCMLESQARELCQRVLGKADGARVTASTVLV